MLENIIKKYLFESRRFTAIVQKTRLESEFKKAQDAAEEIRKLSGNGNIVVEKLDLASLESVRSFAEKINKQEERINILINNAGKKLQDFFIYSLKKLVE